MILIEYHLGLRQVVMALMNWAIDVPQKLLQSDAKPFLTNLLWLKPAPRACLIKHSHYLSVACIFFLEREC
jgi:hypothetical protein